MAGVLAVEIEEAEEGWATRQCGWRVVREREGWLARGWRNFGAPCRRGRKEGRKVVSGVTARSATNYGLRVLVCDFDIIMFLFM